MNSINFFKLFAIVKSACQNAIKLNKTFNPNNLKALCAYSWILFPASLIQIFFRNTYSSLRLFVLLILHKII